MRRFAFLAAVLAAQLATGCYCHRPYYAFPRLQNLASCTTGGCAVPIGGGGPAYRPLISGPLTSAPISGGFPVGGHALPGDYSTPLPSYSHGDHGFAPPGIGGGSGCASCGASGGGHSISLAPPAYQPNAAFGGYPPAGGYAVPGAYSTPGPYAPGAYQPGGGGVSPAPMPMIMPSAMPGGVPHDSALLKMPTIVPPTTAKRPEELARQAGGK